MQDSRSGSSRTSAWFSIGSTVQLRGEELGVIGIAVGSSPASRDFLTPSPPAEKATARQDQAGKSSADDGGRWAEWTFCYSLSLRPTLMSFPPAPTQKPSLVA